jgi:hypothetical protein
MQDARRIIAYGFRAQRHAHASRRISLNDAKGDVCYGHPGLAAVRTDGADPKHAPKLKYRIVAHGLVVEGLYFRIKQNSPRVAGRAINRCVMAVLLQSTPRIAVMLRNPRASENVCHGLDVFGPTYRSLSEQERTSVGFGSCRRSWRK